jgi:hypothetical protein
MNARLRFVCAVLFLTSLSAGPPEYRRFLLLDNRQLLEGDIERDGNYYKLRRDGGETVLPAKRVLAVCGDRLEAYQFLLSKIDMNSIDHRLKLAEWCHNNDLPKQAVSEARLALELRPSNVIAQRFLKRYEQAAAHPKRPAFAAPQAKAEPEALPESLDCSPEALRHFCTKVQPVLMNACANCHTATTKFHLQRVFPDSLNSRPMTFQNLAAALSHVDRSQPATSALLVKALTPHGNGHVPPLRDRGTPAFQQLEIWIRMLAGEEATTVLPQPKPPEEKKSGFGADRLDEKPTGPKDPFDPIEFNRKNHPDRP